MSLGQLTSDVFLSCTPTAVAIGATVPAGVSQRPLPTIFTTEYCFTAPAACATAEWTATYTIREVCTGNPATWTQPSVPPNFIKTVVTCDVCEHRTQTITCPVEQSIQTGSVKIHGNGVTATPALAAVAAGGAAMSAAALGSSSTSGSNVPGSKPGSAAGAGTLAGSNFVSGSDSPWSNTGSAAAAAAAIVGSNSFAGTGSSGSNSSSAAAMALAGPSHASGSGFSGSNSGSAAAVAAGIVGSNSFPNSGSSAANMGLGADGMFATMAMPESNTETEAASSTYDTAGAPILGNSIVLMSAAFALALVASRFIL
ncbi:hypothetical protein VMCG_04621 [Cytospora schulzeri]|uniref:Uncharacterized protein n=1 Tax=Cytospora schulzeri TaxID=448051 RepID=A0A423WRI4_9PEZI|nr:hypothetical protein VMCG_04621 [Valsa malicola]